MVNTARHQPGSKAAVALLKKVHARRLDDLISLAVYEVNGTHESITIYLGLFRSSIYYFSARITLAQLKQILNSIKEAE